MKYPFLLLLGLALFGAGCESEIPGPSPEPVACTADAKQCPDGSYVGRVAPRCEFAPCPPAKNPDPTGRRCAGSGDASCGRGYDCTQECGPPVARDTDPEPGWSCYPSGSQRMCPICLASSTMIATPKGDIHVTELQVGTHVWTLDKHGKKVMAPIIEIGKTFVASSHLVVHLVLADGREVRVSPGHPTSDGRTMGELNIGDTLDGSKVKNAELVPYGEEATYDLLPSGDTGAYWADGILMGSTLR